MTRELLVRRVYRIGVQTIERDGERYFLTIRNRTYASEVEVPIETAQRYARAMGDEIPCGTASGPRDVTDVSPYTERRQSEP